MNDRTVPASRWNTRRTKMIGVSLVMLGSAAFLTGCAGTGSLGSLGTGSGSGGSSGGGSGTSTTVPPTTTITAPPVGSGSLALKPVTAPNWSDQNGPIDINTMIVVPGDVLTFNAKFALELKGTGLKAKLFTNDLGVSGDSPLLEEFKPVTTVSLDGRTIPVGATGEIVDTTQDGKNVDVTIKFTFDKAATNLSMEQSVRLAEFNVSLVQQPT
ncbi:alternate-type signal peptide domain-containing protein [Rhodococcus sp. OK302]|uniref:alternate-type signal peptide domain-containing protein n=1 Tax=Rhodococcus sp. OK302 TaxID=1882769 RepID=UPI000B9F47F5|nr:alternate-type signal peptide domain-containing protein [Rhodococcus sp. OK302]OYD66697.1 alternate signal-mediated exported protein [Rhodococcus sp. OK302]